MKSLFTAVAAAVLLLATGPLVSAQEQSHAFSVTNHTSQAIEYIQISPPSDSQWGDDWLAANEVLEPDASRTFTIDGDCIQDIRVTWMDHHSREWRNFDTCQYDLSVESQ
jgi:hypothetical protein